MLAPAGIAELTPAASILAFEATRRLIDIAKGQPLGWIADRDAAILRAIGAGTIDSQAGLRRAVGADVLDGLSSIGLDRSAGLSLCRSSIYLHA